MSPLESTVAASAYNQMNGARDLPNLPKTRDHVEARQKAQEFESVFLSQMLQPMFANIEAEAPFSGGNSENMWRSMQVEEYGKAITKAGGIGIADAVYREILKMQEMR
ncbi:MAG: chemotaxis protein [Rhodospirillaceae bacterium]|jgi:Rod binding domain-containing protein|nr:chemotaxis protein [Rhodospirillaceae bacterium]MBT3908438.1 chemotaxis protein [Rhodospirillaceae bacterium]MBT5298864.1 chemotaxis protein [Rhodospirillaceae bacterium]MBT5513857.1 chemotaxis protein [Rhodospirillaceae bacterium]MBT6086964.1 chemotaxis protein [Rhodospirillaceae bacterium]